MHVQGLILALALCASPGAQDGDLPIVTGVEPQPLIAQVLRLGEALDYLGSGLPLHEAAEIRALADLEPTPELVARVQDILDPFCLAVVEINPEARVKVSPGPAPAVLQQSGWRTYLVKVLNGAHITPRLVPVSPNALPTGYLATGAERMLPDNELTPGQLAHRFLEVAHFDHRPMKKRLSGLELEYVILQIYCRDAGAREARIGFTIGQGSEDLGFRNAVDYLFQCEPAVKVRLRVRDVDGAPTTAAFIITDDIERLARDRVTHPLPRGYRNAFAAQRPWDVTRTDGRHAVEPAQQGRLRGIYPLPSRRVTGGEYPDFFFQPQVYRADGEHVLLPAGEYGIEVTRGPEYLPIQRKLVVPTGVEELEVEFQLERWIHLSALGWYSADHHVHGAGCSHYESPAEGVRAEDLWRQVVGEDLNFAGILNWAPCWMNQKTFFDGEPNDHSTENNILRYDVEVSGFPSSHAGHLALLGLSEDDYPGANSIDDWPSWTLPILRWAKGQGGTVGYAHAGLGLEPAIPTLELPNYLPVKFDSIGANEYIVTVTHDAVDFLGVGNTPTHWELNIWYHTLNVGFRPRISGETDFPCIFDERLGMARTYAKLADGLDFDRYMEALRTGQSYVTEGGAHVLDFRVEDLELGSGASELLLDAAREVDVRARVAALLPEKQTSFGAFLSSRGQDEAPYWELERARLGTSRRVRVELIVNGEAVAHQDVEADGDWRQVAFKTHVARSSWIALRILYACHTNPIFLLVDGRPIRASKKSAEWCRAGVDKCWRTKSPQMRGSEIAAAKAAYDHARAVYDRRIEECAEIDRDR